MKTCSEFLNSTFINLRGCPAWFYLIVMALFLVSKLMLFLGIYTCLPEKHLYDLFGIFVIVF